MARSRDQSRSVLPSCSTSDSGSDPCESHMPCHDRIRKSPPARANRRDLPGRVAYHPVGGKYPRVQRSDPASTRYTVVRSEPVGVSGRVSGRLASLPGRV
eukprot:164725-Hanusia_phi.AAC.1